MKRISRVFLMVLVLLLVMGYIPFVAPMTTVAANNTYTFGVSGTIDYDSAFEMLEQLNLYRASMGAPALIMDSSLLDLSAQRAAECAIYFDHIRPNGVDMCANASVINENISGANGGSDYSATRAMEAWKSSPGHNSTMTDPVWNAVGIARFDQGNGDFYWVQVFSTISSPTPTSNPGVRQETRNITALDSVLTLGVFPSSASIKLKEEQSFIVYNAVNKGIGVSLQPTLDFDFYGVFDSYGYGTCQIIPAYCNTSDSSVVTVSSSGIATGVSAGSAVLNIGVDSTLYKEVSITVSSSSNINNGDVLKVVSSSPVSGSFDVFCDTIIDITFNNSSINILNNSSITLHKNQISSTPIKANVIQLASNPATIRIIPDEELEENSYYRVQIKPNTIMANNEYFAGLTNNEDFYFRTGIGKGSHPLTGQIKVDFVIDHADSNHRNQKMNIFWSDEFFIRESTEYYNDMAIASLVLANSAYSKNGIETTLKSLGFDNFEPYYNYSDIESERVAHAFGSKTVTMNGKTYNIVVVALRGTQGMPEWVNNLTRFSKGFEGAEEKVKENLQQYIEDYNLNEEVMKFLVVGHSRGAAVGNILGEDLADSGYGANNIYVYGFATPKTTHDDDGQTYTNIFSIVNKDDLVTSYGINHRYGTDRPFYSINNASLNQKFKELTVGNSLEPKTIFNAHSTTTYMAQLLLGGTASSGLGDDSITIYVKCPVDVAVYNSYGTLTGRVSNNTVDNSVVSDVLIWTNGDEKIITMSAKQNYRIELTGTSIGAMEYIIAESDGKGTILREVVYKDVPLNKGIEYSANVSGRIGSDPSGYNLASDDGTIISYSYVTDGNNGLPFSDIKQTDWFYDTVYSVYTEGLMVGTSATTFSPNGNVTIAQAITMAARALAGGDDPFNTSSGGNWYDSYVSYAISNGIIKSNDFSDYNAVASRAQMAYIFSCIVPMDAPETSSLTPPDVKESYKYGKEIYRLYRTGVLNGNDSQGTFASNSNITRAQAAAIILRVHLLLTAGDSTQANPEVSASSDVVSFSFSNAKWNTTYTDEFDTFEIRFFCKSEQIIASAGIKCWDDSGIEVTDDGGKISNFDTQYFKYRTNIYYTAWDNGSNTGKLVLGKTYYWVGYAICDGQRYETPVKSFVFSKDGARYK